MSHLVVTPVYSTRGAFDGRLKSVHLHKTDSPPKSPLSRPLQRFLTMSGRLILSTIGAKFIILDSIFDGHSVKFLSTAPFLPVLSSGDGCIWIATTELALVRVTTDDARAAVDLPATPSSMVVRGILAFVAAGMSVFCISLDGQCTLWKWQEKTAFQRLMSFHFSRPSGILDVMALGRFVFAITNRAELFVLSEVTGKQFTRISILAEPISKGALKIDGDRLWVTVTTKSQSFVKCLNVVRDEICEVFQMCRLPLIDVCPCNASITILLPKELLIYRDNGQTFGGVVEGKTVMHFQMFISTRVIHFFCECLRR
jgi:hypothetical protein